MTHSFQWAKASCLSWILDHNKKHHNRYDTSVGLFNPTQRSVPANTQHLLHEKEFLNTGWIRARNPIKRAAAEPRLKPRIFEWVTRNKWCSKIKLGAVGRRRSIWG